MPHVHGVCVWFGPAGAVYDLPRRDRVCADGVGQLAVGTFGWHHERRGAEAVRGSVEVPGGTSGQWVAMLTPTSIPIQGHTPVHTPNSYMNNMATCKKSRASTLLCHTPVHAPGLENLFEVCS